MKRKHSLLKTITILNSFALGGLFLINRSISSAATSKHILKSDGSFYQWRYGNVYYRTDGTGEQPLLLIHDAAASSSGYDWSALTARLKESYRVYTLDLLGCGRSDKPGITYTNYLYVCLISDFIRDVIGESTVLAAAGLSASFAVMAAHAHPEQIKELKLINPISLKELAQVPDTRSRLLRSLLGMPVIGTSIYHILCSRQNLEYYLDDKQFYNPFRVTGKLLDAGYEASHIGSGNGKYFQASKDSLYLNWNISRALGTLGMPVSVACGDHYTHGQEIARQYQAVLPQTKIFFIPDSKGLPQIENPSRLSDLLFAV